MTQARIENNLDIMKEMFAGVVHHHWSQSPGVVSRLKIF
jgi:hypothetical protein